MSTAFERNSKFIDTMMSGIPIVAIRDARTGKLNSDGTINSDVREGLDHPYIWVRPGSQRAEVRAININVNDQTPNLQVLVGFHRLWNEMVVMSVDAPAVTHAYGDATATLNTPRRAGGLVDELVKGYNIAPGQVYIETGVVLRVRQFPYVDSAGSEKVWQDASGNLDISGDVPGSANEHALTRISLNPDADSPALVSTVGTAQNNLIPFQPSDVLDISIPAGHISLAVVRLENGDTSLTLDRFWDWRFFASEGVEVGDELNAQLTTVSTTKVIAANTEVRVSKMTVTGKLTVTGRLLVCGC
jgi:hypothetical protein